MLPKRSLASCFGLVIAGGLAAQGAGAVRSAYAGGLYLPGIGAVSTARAGASVASIDNGEALLINPARLTHLAGTQIMLGMSLIDFELSFKRLGTYDDVDNKDLAWEGDPYPELSDNSSPAIGAGPFQLIPMLTVSTDLGCRIPGLVVAGGIYAPQGYPSRDFESDYAIDDLVEPPPASRYDVMKEGAKFLVATVGAGYRALPSLDVGARFGVGFGDLQAKSFLWGVPNFDEYTGNDGVLDLDATDNFMPTFGFGVSFRPHPNIEVAAQYTGALSFSGEGTSKAQLSQYLTLGGVPAELLATPDDEARCAKGGTDEALATCVELELPMSASIGGRYKFLDAKGVERGDLELNLGWENWGAERSSDFRVVVDAQVNGIVTLKDGLIRHGFRDTFAARLGGSYRLPVAAQELVLRAGVSYDTAAAKDGWERLDYDGAARTMLAIGASYQLGPVQLDAGGGAILEGTRNVGELCNPEVGNLGCDGTNSEAMPEDRGGADPINPIFEPNAQSESPMNHGRYSSHYVMFMLGATVAF